MLDSIYHMTLTLKKHIFGVKMSRFWHSLCNIIMDALGNVTKSVNHKWFIDFIA